MNKKAGASKGAADMQVKGFKRKTRKQYSAEKKIRIVMAEQRKSRMPGRCHHASVTRRAGARRGKG
jgi:transposase